ncbi:hypothetical protein FF36_06097 [Frankia torreyi]|uniref:Uncharacterized protein n=1 Tax=Frankia torreyi TaxID=1856 RepID=A0A0D8B899_9ACTN|nr:MULTISPECIES: hypothetical protein [Frankia]KJE19612.1 hypothetical protein FF36_06097 [Frankia torreyi]KQM02040.1 hypothetical protein FF86_10846 [Frankia sp. CpI1-P]
MRHRADVRYSARVLGKANGVFVATRTSDLTKAVLPFLLTVTC